METNEIAQLIECSVSNLRRIARKYHFNFYQPDPMPKLSQSKEFLKAKLNSYNFLSRRLGTFKSHVINHKLSQAAAKKLCYTINSYDFSIGLYMLQEKKILAVEVQKGQRICCPLPEHASWNQHPRVYIDLEDESQGICPYCSTKFIITDQ